MTIKEIFEKDRVLQRILKKAFGSNVSIGRDDTKNSFGYIVYCYDDVRLSGLALKLVNRFEPLVVYAPTDRTFAFIFRIPYSIDVKKLESELGIETEEVDNDVRLFWETSKA